MTTATKINEHTLAALFMQAAKAAADADPGEGLENDGGTCNFDTPAFRVDRMKAATIEKACNLSGVPASQFTWSGGRRWWWLMVPMNGQANRRTTMMQAAQKVLSEAAESLGDRFHTCGYMQSD